METAEAIRKGIADCKDCPINFDPKSVKTIWKVARGYPYFVQHVCREVFDIWVQAVEVQKEPPSIPVAEIVAKLDSDFFAGRWAKATGIIRSHSRITKCFR